MKRQNPQTNQASALGLEYIDDSPIGRKQRGMAIAALVRIKKNRLGYKVPSQSGNGFYIVNTNDEPLCTCPDFEKLRQPCKHIYAVEFIIQREENPNGTTVEGTAMPVAYGQDWAAYNAAQTHEQELFVILLRDLCDTVPQPSQTMGRPRLRLSDMLFGVALKVYSTMSGRRAMTDFRNAQADGLLVKCPSFTSTFRYMEDPTLTPLLRLLIEQSALPLKSVECDFAIDSSGFSTSVYDRWYDQKWGKAKKKARYVKAHLMCGVKTNIVTAVEVTGAESADATRLPPFLNTTAQNFDVTEVSADKAYLSKKNLRAVEAIGGTAYIPFKANSTGHQGHHKRDSLWEKTYYYYNFNRAEFEAHYHKRSNVESTFSMIKAKFGGSVRCKTGAAQVNEVLAKILCHNICVLIQSTYELGIEPVFRGQGAFGTKELFDEKVVGK